MAPKDTSSSSQAGPAKQSTLFGFFTKAPATKPLATPSTQRIIGSSSSSGSKSTTATKNASKESRITSPATSEGDSVRVKTKDPLPSSARSVSDYEQKISMETNFSCSDPS